MIWNLLHLVDILLWIFTAISVGYVAFFAIASLRHHHDIATVDAEQRHFLVLIPAYHEDAVIINTARQFLLQDYPKQLYQLVVISDHMQPATNEQLASLSLTLLTPTFQKSSKAKALKYAIDHIKSDTSFDRVVILDADNIVAPNFLRQLNAACASGHHAIQCHRTAKNSENDIAVLDGVSEEINNTIFRRAHNNVHLSSALIGSGMCFDYHWFCQNVGALESAVEDRELEALLAMQNIYVKYEEDIHVMDEKVSSRDNFQRQRMRWMTGQVQTFFRMLPYLPKALRTGNINYIDKHLQQMLIPRSVLLVFLPVYSILMTIIAQPWSLKWWVLFISFCLSLYIAIPKRLRNRAVFARLTALPKLVWQMTINLFHIDKNNTDFIHTTHDK